MYIVKLINVYTCIRNSFQHNEYLTNVKEYNLALFAATKLSAKEDVNAKYAKQETKHLDIST
jgi:hypothetical protein